MIVTVGDIAPDLRLPDHAGDLWHLQQHRGRHVILIFHRHLM